MKEANIIFPHQLFKNNKLLTNGQETYLVEEHLFFKEFKFHKQKIAFHRASMKFYESYLKSMDLKVHYIESSSEISDIRKLLPYLAKIKVQKINYIDPTDNWLEKRIRLGLEKFGLKSEQFQSQLFLNKKEELAVFFKEKNKKFFQTKFYIAERKKRKILIDEDEKPIQGKWSFDAENRKKYPKSKLPPPVSFPNSDEFHKEAIDYTEQNFSNNPGQIGKSKLYPSNFTETQNWLQQFLEFRFMEFGTYEDAIVSDQIILNHSVLSPMLNVGLIDPKSVIDQTLKFAKQNNVPINSTEGFVRQIIGWREFIRGVYECKGSVERTKNFWQFERKIPASFYDGTTGIEPVDNAIKKVLQTGYCHHIERLMILGNFMVLCEFHPDEVYRWFMELFIDSYDWVMVPNVYGMSQFADGGLMSTKPYISGSNYLMKMSNFKKGDWQKTWDGLFWRFMHVHRDFFLKNPRLGMLVRMFDKMEGQKQQAHLLEAETYLSSL